MSKKQSFEEALNKLEGIVENFESGELALEEMVQQFEEGSRLAKFCLQKLDEAENKITSFKISDKLEEHD